MVDLFKNPIFIPKECFHKVVKIVTEIAPTPVPFLPRDIGHNVGFFPMELS